MTWERFAADMAKKDAEIERLRAENAAMRPIVEAVASAVVMTRGNMPDVIKRAIMFTPERSIKGRYQGQEMTPVMKARAARAQARRAERIAAQQAAL